ncbi:MAG: metal-dependent hydrolase [Deltaproteobacteria bacterium]|nr:MAG: metal-dependent hydrolase [Deltaproteobacteria bacterium]
MGGAGHLARRRGPRVKMDNLTHAFAAITCSHAISRERPSGLTLAAAVLAANVQDVDWLPFVSSPAAGLEVHRGTMHSLLAVPLLALVVAAGVHLAARQRGNGAAPLPFRPLLGVCLAAAASHPLLDLLNPYGLRPLLPFDGTWCYGDLAGIRDPWMWLILGGSALLLSGRHAASVSTWTVLGSLIVVAALRMIPAQGTFGVVAGLVWIAGAGALLITWLRGVDPHARRAIARGGLAVTVLYVGCLVVLHQRAMSRAYTIAERTAGEHAERAVRVAAIPTVGDLSTWRGLAETERSVYRFAIPLGAASEGLVERFRSIRDPTVGALAQADATRLTRAFLSFARFAAAEVGTEDGRRVLLLADPRYDKAQPDQPRTWPVREPLDP